MTLLCNHRRLWRSLLATAVAVSFASACSSPDEEDNSPGDLTGVITGTIMDSNGAPIEGVIVRYSGASADDVPLEATTNVNGQFRMPEVIVTGITEPGNAVNDANGPITLALDAPGHMGATVLVNPQAQASGSVGGGTIFLDNFNVDTGPVKLPALNTTVSGVLRDQSTGTPVRQARITLDFRGVEFDQDGTTGIAATYNSVANRVATTDNNGTFSFTGVYADSCLGLVVTDYSVESVTGSAPPCTAPGTDPNALYFATSDDGGILNLANVSVASFNSGDTVAPVVSAVQGVVDATQNPAQLESSVDDTLVVVFSEPLSADLLDTSDVTVVLGGQTAVEVDAVTLEGNAVTVTLSEDLPNNTAVELHLAREALKDLAGNGVALSAAIAYDSLSSSDLILSFTSFSPSSTVADAAEVAQVSAQVDVNDLAYETTDALLDTVAADSEDIRPARTSANATTAYPAGATAVEHLNAAAAFEELDRLYDFVDPDGEAGAVTTGLARVRVQKPANANDFVVWLERDGATLDASFYPVATGSGNPQNTAVIVDDGPTYVITPNGATSFDLLVRSPTPAVFVVEPGDVFHIVSRNTAGLLGKEATLSLRDIGRPSVAVQTLGLLLAGTQGGSEVGGSGTVILPATDTAPAKLLLPVTPQAADINDTENGTDQATGFGNDDWKGTSELQGLSDDLLVDSEFAEGLATTEAIGDADGTAAFLAQPTTLGITLTEPAVDLNAAPVTSDLESATVSADPANSDVFNGLPNEDGSFSDVFFVKLNSPFALAADALAGTVDISLQPSIADLNGVRPDAGTRALVQVTDRMPPLMTLAFYDGVNFVFRFNEAVRAAGIIVLEQCAASIDLASTADSNADTILDVQQIDSATFKVQSHVVDDVVGDLATCFGLPPYAEASYSAGALNDPALTSVNPADEPPHGAITYQSVQDLAGGGDSAADNSWERWAAEALGITKPFFAMANITPAP